MNDKHSSERWIVGTLLIVALLTFFFPLVSLQVPILGSQEVSGYDLISKAKEFDRALDAVKSKGLGESISTPSQLEPNDSESSESRSTMPLSAQTLSLIPIEIVVGFACALIALLFCLGSFSSTPTKAFSTLGSVAAVAAILHLTVANSDLHSWFREQMKVDSSALANNPFAGLARQIENLAVTSVQLRPGAGLYVLAAALSLAAVLVISRVLSVSTATEATLEPYPDERNGRARSFAFFALFLVALTVAVIVLVHKPGTGARNHDAAQPSPSGSQESDIFKWPTIGLPAYIAAALKTPDLSVSAPEDGTKELTLGVDGQKQFIPAVKEDDCMGSGGCNWMIKDAATQRVLLEDSQGELHKTQRLKNGYYDMLVEGKWGLYLYEYNGEKYVNTRCYERSDDLGSPARPARCQGDAEQLPTATKTSMGYPVPEKEFVDAYVLANSGREDLSETQLTQLAHDEYTMGSQIDTQTLLMGGDILSTRGKRAMDYLETIRRQGQQLK